MFNLYFFGLSWRVQGINQVNHAVSELDRVNQQNVALVDESMASSRSVDGQVKRLEELMGFFKLDR